MEKSVVSKEELDQLKEFDKKGVELIREMGVIATQLVTLERQTKELSDKKLEIYEGLEKFEKENQDFHKELTEKYGEGIRVDFETGEITSQLTEDTVQGTVAGQ